MYKSLGFTAVATILASSPIRAAAWDDGLAERPHVRVAYTGVDAAYGDAVARLVEAAYTAYVDRFGFDMPQRVNVTIDCAPDNKLRLWTDGRDHVTLTLKSARQLRKPSSSGVFNVYGFCHELGHMAMYRTLKNRRWLSGDAAEGWAHYCGSYVVDRVYAAEGEDLWPDAYDYRDDGTRRLDAQLESAKPSKVAAAAGRWRALAKLVGRKKLPDVFRAWEDADIDPTDPNDELRGVVVEAVKKSRRARAKKWFETFVKICVVKVSRSVKPYRTVRKSGLAGDPMLLKHDDGTSDGRRSIAGGGHAVFFDAPPGDWYVTGVHIYGSRYGRPRAPDEDVAITLCDAELKPIRAWREPYRSFKRAEPQWHRIDVKPTSVSGRFAICFEFNPAQTRGVFVHRDDSTGGHSATGLPGRSFRMLDGGNWMIRVELDRLKSANSLRGQ